MWQPAAVASRAAVSFVAMPPVPHCVPGTLVSTCISQQGNEIMISNRARQVCGMMGKCNYTLGKSRGAYKRDIMWTTDQGCGIGWGVENRKRVMACL